MLHRLPIRLSSLCLALLAPGVLAPVFAAETPSIARPALPGQGTTPAAGLVFFLTPPGSDAPVAVGAAHSLPLDRITASPRIDFFTANSRRRIASSTRFVTEPGRPFDEPGASLAGDLVVYALDGPQAGFSPLRAAEAPPLIGARVRILGAPSGAADQISIAGRVAARRPERLEVDLDELHDLRGWGGAPVLNAASGRVVGIVQAHVRRGETARIIAAPIRAAVEALASPLAGGRGAFSRFQAATRSTPASLARDAGANAQPPDMEMAIEYPPAGSRVSSSVCGVFVAGRAAAHRGGARRFDVMLVIDTSRSTGEPSGADVNGNGVTATARVGRLDSLFAASTTDSGDSILASEIAAARQILDGLDPRNTRVGLVSFAGDPPRAGRPRRSAVVVEPLTGDYAAIHRALDGILEREPEGSTDMAAGVDQAVLALMRADDAGRERVVFFFTDGQPTLPYGDAAEADNVRAVLRAANRAGSGGVRVHTFAIGPDALEGPIAVVELASRTDGYFTPVRHPGDLQSVVEEVRFANLDDLALTNLTTRAPARYFRATVDGSWAALVPMDPGANRVRAWARADDGAEIAQLRDVLLDPEVESPPIPEELAFRRNRLLEDCLRDAKRRRQSAEAKRAEAVRRDLMLEIERERAKARLRADHQRKELELEAAE